MLGLVDDAGYVRDTSSADVAQLFGDGSPAQIAVVLRAMTRTLDLRRRDVLRLCAVICRTGPLVWQPSDLRCRVAVGDEARALELRPGEVFLIGEAGWRDGAGHAGSTPVIAPVAGSPWGDRPS